MALAWVDGGSDAGDRLQSHARPFAGSMSEIAMSRPLTGASPG